LDGLLVIWWVTDYTDPTEVRAWAHELGQCWVLDRKRPLNAVRARRIVQFRSSGLQLEGRVVVRRLWRARQRNPSVGRCSPKPREGDEGAPCSPFLELTGGLPSF
jgi:hypothetical protein